MEPAPLGLLCRLLYVGLAGRCCRASLLWHPGGELGKNPKQPSLGPADLIQGRFSRPGDLWQHLDMFSVVMSGGRVLLSSGV